ncbi:WXG100 family type VII secretion target [Nocardia sp. NPDC127579]|uniref:WXG100 family type VII secretion target n=1 Tax=Nocardia sp. NPDC127579 TaxID=3345402 RepID=UPI003639AAEC
MAGNDDFKINPEQVKAQAPKLAELATDLSTGLSALRSGLDSIGNAWGDDEFGQRFAANYTSKAADALSAIEGAVQMFQFLEKGVDTTGKTFENLDEEFQSAITKITSKIDDKD